jgi:BCD family chlorophyll transporter-like MFS transporter
MGVWGAAQAGGFAIGGFLGALGVDLTRRLTHDSASAFLVVFVGEAAVFLAAAVLAARLDGSPSRRLSTPSTPKVQFGGAL